MKKMLEAIDLFKREADLNHGAVALNAEQAKSFISLLELCNKVINEQGKFIEEMKAEALSVKPMKRSW